MANACGGISQGQSRILIRLLGVLPVHGLSNSYDEPLLRFPIPRLNDQRERNVTFLLGVKTRPGNSALSKLTRKRSPSRETLSFRHLGGSIALLFKISLLAKIHSRLIV